MSLGRSLLLMAAGHCELLLVMIFKLLCLMIKWVKNHFLLLVNPQKDLFLVMKKLADCT